MGCNLHKLSRGYPCFIPLLPTNFHAATVFVLRPLAYACCPSPLRSVVIYDPTTIASLFEAFLSWVLQLDRKGFPFLKFLEFCFSIGYDGCQSWPVSFSTACLVSVWRPCLLLPNLPLLALAVANYFLSLILKMSTVPQGSKFVINVLPIFQATQPELVRKQSPKTKHPGPSRREMAAQSLTIRDEQLVHPALSHVRGS